MIGILSPRPGQSALRGTQTGLVLVMALYRSYGVAQAGVAVAFDAGRYPSLPPVVAFLAAVAVENIVLIALCVRRRLVRPGLVLADTALAIAGLFIGARLTYASTAHTWAYFMYPVTMVGSMAIGFAYRRLSTVVLVTVALAAAYVAAAVTIHHDPVWNAIPNALSYPANTAVAWAAATYMRSLARRLDQARAAAVEQAARAAREETRARHARALHDRALQTLEFLAQGPWIREPALRTQVAADAAWLRGFVEDPGTASEATDLLTSLQALVQRMALTGLHVDLNTAQLREAPPGSVPGSSVAVLVDATGEALTNVAKHSGASHATVRVHLHPESVEVSVTDRGRGFDVSKVPGGTGLRASITERMAEAGGRARIESAPGAGTIVRLTAPRGTEPDRGHVAEPASESPRDRQGDAALQRNAP